MFITSPPKNHKINTTKNVVNEVTRVLDKDSLIVTIEAGNISSWKKYLGSKGMSLGIDRFGERFKKIS